MIQYKSYEIIISLLCPVLCIKIFPISFVVAIIFSLLSRKIENILGASVEDVLLQK